MSAEDIRKTINLLESFGSSSKSYTAYQSLDDYPSEGDEIEIRITYEYTPGCPAQTYGPADNCYPAEAAEIEVIEIMNTDTGEKIEYHDLSLEQQENIRSQIRDNHEEDDGPDPDDARDRWQDDM
jgi:hypothetical protein